MATCEWCWREFDRPHARGPVPKFCRNSHRQRAYEQRRALARALEAREILETGFWCDDVDAYFPERGDGESGHYDYPCGWTDRGGTFHPHETREVIIVQMPKAKKKVEAT